jgi:hypothetical protein
VSFDVPFLSLIIYHSRRHHQRTGWKADATPVRRTSGEGLFFRNLPALSEAPFIL